MSKSGVEQLEVCKPTEKGQELSAADCNELSSSRSGINFDGRARKLAKLAF